MHITPELAQFLSTVIFESTPEADAETLQSYRASTGADRIERIVTQLRTLAAAEAIALDDLGTHSNRWFGDEGEARDWLKSLISLLQNVSTDAGGALVVKDSNGAALAEGDSVIVIKDLKVRGGSSDLKRGTLVKKIHLIDDPEVIECRVDGSTLVLKTCFLKKA